MHFLTSILAIASVLFVTLSTHKPSFPYVCASEHSNFDHSQQHVSASSHDQHATSTPTSTSTSTSTSKSISILRKVLKKTSTSTSLLYDWDAGVDQVGVKLTMNVGGEYILPKGTTLYHGTSNLYRTFAADPTWFSIRYEQSCAHALYSLAEIALAGGDNKYAESHIPNPEFLTRLQKIAKKVYVKKCTTNRDLRLLYLNYDEPASIAALKKETNDKFQNKFLIGRPSTETVKPISESTFCTGNNQQNKLPWDGWRNPYDQDEVMICGNKLDTAITCQVKDDSFSVEALWKKCGVMKPVRYQSQYRDMVKYENHKQGAMMSVNSKQCSMNGKFFVPFAVPQTTPCDSHCPIMVEGDSAAEEHHQHVKKHHVHNTAGKKIKHKLQTAAHAYGHGHGHGHNRALIPMQ